MTLISKVSPPLFWIALFPWTATVLFGAILFETLIVYPNIFHDVPRSLETAVRFAAVRGPHHFFPPMGMLTILSACGAIVSAWRNRPVRYLFIASFALIVVFEFLFSALFFWGRNTIMFDEGLRVHSATYLSRVAREFQAGHWIRLLASGIASLTAFIGLTEFCRRTAGIAPDSH
jgi:hypothetical protein